MHHKTQTVDTVASQTGLQHVTELTRIAQSIVRQLLHILYRPSMCPYILRHGVGYMDRLMGSEGGVDMQGQRHDGVAIRLCIMNRVVVIAASTNPSGTTVHVLSEPVLFVVANSRFYRLNDGKMQLMKRMAIFSARVGSDIRHVASHFIKLHCESLANHTDILNQHP